MTKQGKKARRQAVRTSESPPSKQDEGHDRAYGHLRFGWWGLAVFLSMGAVLEAMHGLKIGLYLDVSNETRRLMWTLAHAHGTLLSVVNIVFGLTLRTSPGLSTQDRSLASGCLYGATFVLPFGFILGGTFIHDGDPGLGVLLVPVGALLMLIGVSLTAKCVRR